MGIPVIINNRNLLTWPKAMVERIQRYEGVGEIVIVDNESTYPPLLEWYATNPCRIERHANVGIAAPWLTQVVANLKAPFYVVTDPDMGLEETPDDTLLYLKDKMNILNIDKIGLGLDWQRVEDKSPYYKRLRLYEKDRWEKSPVQNDVYMDVQIDTTFALYNVDHYFIGGGSTPFPYVARHYPWEFSIEEARNSEEFMYYMDNATSASSYKTLIKL
jgi:glycosyltransferase involved in cell wall biosynthesis